MDEMMRCAHSLKGASRMMGFKTIESLSHYLETLLTQLIHGEKEVTPTIIDVLYRDVDAVSHAFSALEEGKEPEGIDGVLEQMQIAVGEKSPSEAAPADNPKEARQEPRPSPGAAQASIRR